MLRTPARSAMRVAVVVGGLAAGTYVASVVCSWARYGRVGRTGQESDDLLDRFLPDYDVIERHQVRVGAPAAITPAAARKLDLTASPAIRAIFRAREVILGAAPDECSRPRGLIRQVQSLGWLVLAERPDREIVVGAVTRPWEPHVTFRGVPPEEFAAFDEPDYVKIVWNLRADPLGPCESLFRTETRATATDAAARAKFRWYWSFFSPGIRLIRWLSLSPLKSDAEARGNSSRDQCAHPLQSDCVTRAPSPVRSHSQ
jgi:hypothetical protein